MNATIGLRRRSRLICFCAVGFEQNGRVFAQLRAPDRFAESKVNTDEEVKLRSLVYPSTFILRTTTYAKPTWRCFVPLVVEMNVGLTDFTCSRIRASCCGHKHSFTNIFVVTNIKRTFVAIIRNVSETFWWARVGTVAMRKIFAFLRSSSLQSWQSFFSRVMSLCGNLSFLHRMRETLLMLVSFRIR